MTVTLVIVVKGFARDLYVPRMIMAGAIAEENLQQPFQTERNEKQAQPFAGPHTFHHFRQHVGNGCSKECAGSPADQVRENRLQPPTKRNLLFLS